MGRDIPCRGVVVEWICHRTVDHKVRGSSPTAALMSFGKTLIYICHTLFCYAVSSVPTVTYNYITESQQPISEAYNLELLCTPIGCNFADLHP